MRSYNKLVRDKIINIIQSNDEEPIYRYLEDAEFKVELEKKLLEECQEVIEAHNEDDHIEELADVLEVILSLAKLHDVSETELVEIMKEKRKARGGFDERIFLETVNEKNT